MSKGDLIELRRELEAQIETAISAAYEVKAAVQLLDERLIKLERDFERIRMSVTALNNLVKGNVR